MITIKIEVKNDKKVITDLSRLRKVMRSMLTEALSKSAVEIKKEAKNRVPVRTGKTRRSIKSTLVRKDMQAHVGTDWFVGRLLETGTKYMRARPYLEPALDEKMDFILQAVRNSVNKSIRSVGW